SVAWARGASREAIAQRTWSLAASPLVLNARAAGPAVSRNVSYLTGREPMPRVEAASGADAHDFSQQFAFSLDFWWLYLVYLRALRARAALAGRARPRGAALVCAG